MADFSNSLIKVPILITCFFTFGLLSIISFVAYLVVRSDRLSEKQYRAYFSDNFLTLLSGILPITCIICTIILLIKLPSDNVKWFHLFGVSLLFIFLVLGQYLQIEALVKASRHLNIQTIARTYRRFWVLVETIPALAAIIIHLTGFYLIHKGGFSISSGWLFYLVGGFNLMFIDALLSYRPYIKELASTSRMAINDSGKREELNLIIKDWLKNGVLVLHFASLPFLFLIGYLKPNFKNPIASFFLLLEKEIGYTVLSNYSKVIPSMLWVIIVIGAVVLFHMIIRVVNKRQRGD